MFRYHQSSHINPKIEHIWHKNTELEWFASYLDKCKQNALCHDKSSRLVHIITGMPQGSVLEPFLLLLFINDMVSRESSDICKVMLVGSKAQLKPLTGDEFILNYESKPSELVEDAKYLGMSIKADIVWAFDVQRLCQNGYYHISVIRRSHRIFHKDLLYTFMKSIFNLVKIMVLLCMDVAHRRREPWFKEFRIMPLG